MSEPTAHEYILMLGSNAGNRQRHLDMARDMLTQCMAITSVTPYYDNPDITGRSDDYLNCLIKATSALSSDALRAELRLIEAAIGRDRSTPLHVVVDIDILVCDNAILKPAVYRSSPARHLLPLL